MSTTTNGPIVQANDAVSTYVGPPLQPTGVLNPDELNRIIPLTSSDTASGNSGKVLACVAGIIVGVALIALMGGLGTAGLLHNTGLAQYPQWLVNQINNIPNIYLDVMMYAGYIGGVITIAISGALLYKTLNPKAAETSIASCKAFFAKNDVGTSVEIVPEVKAQRVWTKQQEEFWQGPKGGLRYDKSGFKDSQWAYLPGQWDKKLTEKLTLIYEEYTEKYSKASVYRVIGRDRDGELWISKDYLEIDEKNLMITILENYFNYTTSENQDNTKIFV